jgi:2,4-dienoyl-CoA reductase-like NADH-dependent reductase (Old Yellow Enzyme family)
LQAIILADVRSSSMKLFEPLSLRSVHLRNRIAVSPMCQYSAEEGSATAWHLVHLGSRAVGGVALVIAEASAVEARGRISPGDTGMYDDRHVDAWAPITRFVSEHGAVPAIQLAHAGRKASCALPWLGGRPLAPDAGGWTPVVAPSALSFDERSPVPHALTTEEIGDVIAAFRKAAERALAAGFQIVEIHAAHGYLLHQFLSPLTNHRTDDYGGSFDRRTHLLRQVVTAIRTVWPERLPLFVRISATDWADGGWDIEQSVELARRLKVLGVDVIDVSSGGTLPRVKIPVAPGFQVPFAARIRREAGIATAAVGVITEPQQAQAIIESGEADLVLLGRALLRNPYWPLHAAKTLGAMPAPPVQYLRAY